MRTGLTAVMVALAGVAVAAPPKASFSDVQTSALSVQGTAQAGALWGAGQNVGALAHSQNGDSGTTATTFKVGSLDPAADVAYQFGQSGVNVFLRWVNATSRFEFWNGTGSVLSPLACGLLTASGWNYYASGSDVAQHKFAAPSSGTNRYTAWFDAPSGGTQNFSQKNDGYVQAPRYYMSVSGTNQAYWIGSSGGYAQLYNAGGALEFEGGGDATNYTSAFYAGGTGVAAIKHGGVNRIRVDSNGIGFFNTTPAAKPAATADLKDGLVSLGLATTGGATPLDLDGGPLSCATTTATTAIRQGDATNNTTLDQRGITFSGQNKPWEDLRVSALAVKVPATGGPDFDTFISGTYLYWFDSGTDQSVYFTAQMPHGWDGGAIYPHVHWVPKSTGAANTLVVWGLEYTWAEIGEVFPATQTATSMLINPADSSLVASKHYLTAFDAITPSAAQNGISSVLVCRLYRDADNGDDDYAADAGLLEIDFHYALSSVGSQDELVK